MKPFFLDRRTQMKNKLILAALGFLTASTFVTAKADKITCSDNHEPYYSSEYDMEKRTFWSQVGGEPVDGEKPIILEAKNVFFRIKGPGKFEIVRNNGEVLQTLTLNYKGSDTTQDLDYPYSGTASNYDDNMGCESKFLKAQPIKETK
jgi:hypothetical protein